MSKPPDTITVTFTEEDRQEARRYSEICGCLLFTALKRGGVPVDSVGGHFACIDYGNGMEHYGFDDTDFSHDKITSGSNVKPFYNESVVGKTLTLTREL